MEGGYDGFGVRWVTPLSGGGASIPAPGEFILKDVRDWKKIVTIPDLEAVDFESLAAAELANIDSNRVAVSAISGNGIYERIGALMGFENALVSLIEEPEACNELFTAITDFKIRLAEKYAQYYKADVFVNFDDIASEKTLFMSPDTYRSLIKPHHKRLNEAVINLGMIPVQHTCGKGDLLVEDYIETKAACWSSVQPTNDVKYILETYGDKFCLEGGFDSNGKPGQPDATPEVIEAETERCIKEYGSLPGFIFAGFVLRASLDPSETMSSMSVIMNTFMKYRGKTA
jgi:hypothetical protein